MAVLRAAGALTFGLLALARGGAAEAAARPVLGGFYTDPNHYKSGSLAGTRMISDELGNTPGDDITLVGTDDGADFWTLRGRWLDLAAGRLQVDFAPKGGPGVFEGTVVDGQIVWQDGNHWSRQATPDTAFAREGAPHAADLGGVFLDPNHYQPGSFAGTRMISDKVGSTPGSALTLVGSDDGTSFWTLTGKLQDASGRFVVDFSPKGGPAGLSGTFADGAITWQDGNQWTRAAVAASEAMLV